jgi:NADPH2:quinone reductase
VKAALLSEVDGPLEVVEVPDPAAGDGKTLVRVRAAGINFADVMIRRGVYPQMPELPAILGNEIAGELEDGTRLMGFAGGAGGYAELVAVDPSSLVPLPAQASFAEGASFLLTFLTAYIPLTRQVVLRDGATVLVYAGAGGVGTAAIQVAQALGGRAIAAVGSPEKRDVCLQLGAVEAYVYDELPEDLLVDVVVDPVGGQLFAGSLARLRALGTVIAIGSAAGAWVPVDPRVLVGRNIGVQGFYLGRLMRHDPGVVAAAIGELLALWEQGKLKPLVGAELPLAEVEQAHELVESRRSVGKVVLIP